MVLFHNEFRLKIIMNYDVFFFSLMLLYKQVLNIYEERVKHIPSRNMPYCNVMSVKMYL